MEICMQEITHLYINLRRSRDVVVRPFLAGWTYGRTAVRPSDSFSLLWVAFTLTAHINALYNERVYGKEEHAT